MNDIIVTIRQGSGNDYPQVLALIKEFAAFQKTPEKVTITLDEMIADKDIFKCLVAENSKGEIIGFATFFFAYYSWSGKALYLDDLFIQQAYRKQQAGKQLLDEVIRLARRSDCKKVRWLVSNWNSNAIAFYKKMGAVINDVDVTCDLLL